MDKARVAILMSGRGSNMAALLYAARADDCPYEVVLVSGDKPDAPGLDLAEAEGANVLRLNAKELGASFWKDLQKSLDEARVDLVALAGFMRIIPADFVAAWEGRMINIHPSLLPRHKGLNPHKAVLAAGEATTGATVHFVNAEVDGGAIIDQVEIAVMAGDDEARLADRLLIAEHQLYPRALSRIAAQPFNANWIEARVDEIAGGFEAVFRKDSNGAPGWAVGTAKSAKHFAILADSMLGDDHVSLYVRGAAPDEMADLIDIHSDLYFSPKYYGASGWLAIRLSRRDTDWGQIAQWIERSWLASAPPRLARLRKVADEF